MLSWKIAPALAAGNTVVLKPAETTPLTALFFCDVLRQAELPPGVVNIVTGDGRTGAALVEHPGVDKVAFTGSTEVGKAIQRQLAGTGKRLTLELGGKAANVVFDDCALDQAVEGIVNGIYFNQGHVCCAGSRLLLQESIAEQAIDKLKRRLGTLRVGDPLDKNTDVGAINSAQQLAKIRELVASGEAEGAEIFQPECRLPERGYWFVPTVFTNVAQSYRIAQEEIFGPVLSVLTFRTPGGGGREGEQHRLRPLGRASGRRRARASSGWPSVCAPGWCGRTRSTGSTRPRRSAATRSRASAARAGCTASRRTWSWRVSRLPVRKTYKLFIGGAFPRSESGRTYEADGQNVARASRKDLRDAVVAARAALPKWAGATAYNRGQVLYRVAEMMEARLDEFAALCTGEEEAARAVDRLVWYAGWADKLAQVTGAANPVAGPVLQLHGPGADRRRRHPRARRAASLRTRLAARARARRRQHGRRRRVRAASAPGRRARRGARDRGRPRRRGQHPHRLPGGARTAARRPPRRERARPLRLGRRNRARAARRGQRQTGRARPGGRSELAGDHRASSSSRPSGIRSGSSKSVTISGS